MNILQSIMYIIYILPSSSLLLYFAFSLPLPLSNPFFCCCFSTLILPPLVLSSLPLPPLPLSYISFSLLLLSTPFHLPHSSSSSLSLPSYFSLPDSHSLPFYSFPSTYLVLFPLPPSLSAHHPLPLPSSLPIRLHLPLLLLPPSLSIRLLPLPPFLLVSLFLSLPFYSSPSVFCGYDST